MQGYDQTAGRDLGLHVSLKDTVTCGQQEVVIKLSNVQLEDNPLKSHPEELFRLFPSRIDL